MHAIFTLLFIWFVFWCMANHKPRRRVAKPTYPAYKETLRYAVQHPRRAGEVRWLDANGRVVSAQRCYH